MRRWSHEEDRNQIFPRGHRACRTHGERAKGQYESQWAGIVSIAAKIGCTAETLRRWVCRHELDTGQREGLTGAEQQRIRELEREVRELKKANEILRLASAYFVQAELDRRNK